MHKGDLYILLGLKQESWWGTHQTLIFNIEDQQKWYENIPSNQLFMIALKDDEPVGVAAYTDMIGLIVHSTLVALFYIIAEMIMSWLRRHFLADLILDLRCLTCVVLVLKF